MNSCRKNGEITVRATSTSQTRLTSERKKCGGGGGGVWAGSVDGQRRKNGFERQTTRVDRQREKTTRTITGSWEDKKKRERHLHRE